MRFKIIVGAVAAALSAVGSGPPAGAARSDTAPPAASQAPWAGTADVFNFGKFGAVTVSRGAGTPREVVLFLSGEDGWNPGVVSMARTLADRHAIVAGIDTRHYLAQLEQAPEECVSPASDLENLSHYLQSKLGLKQYLQPTLAGYSSGGTLVYAALAESPEGLFKGALSLGFCPDLGLKKPVCRGAGIEFTARRDSDGVVRGLDFLPSKRLPGRWIALQGGTDQACPAPATRRFMAAVPGAALVMLPKVGHGFANGQDWVPQFQRAFDQLTAEQPAPSPGALPAPVADLPLVIVPATGTPGAVSWFGVFLSGDGGWVGIDKGIAAELAKHDIPIVGWNSLKYFWTRRTPAGAAKDLDRVVRHFARAWGRSRVLLIGYSQGADTMPFMVNRLPPATRRMVGLTTLLGISDNAVFEFHVADWWGNSTGGLPTAPELEHWSGSPYLCLYGADDPDSACKAITGRDGTAIEMPGGHHFDGGYTKVADAILIRLPGG